MSDEIIFNASNDSEVKEKSKKLTFKRNQCYFTHTDCKPYEDTLPEIEPGKFIVDDSCFCPMSEAVKQLNRINDPTSGQLSECYDFPNGRDNGKQIPITRRRDFGDIAEYSQEIKEETSSMNKEILKGQLEVAEKAALDKQLEAVRTGSKSESKSE